MPIRFTVHPSARLVTYSVEGTATLDEAREFLDAVVAHPDFRRGFAFLGDRRMASEPDARYVRALADEVQDRAHLLAPCKWAVAAPTAEGFRMVRLWSFQTLPSGVEAAPFMTPTAAAEWLGVGKRGVGC